MENFEDLTEQFLSVNSGSPAILNLSPINSVPHPSVIWQTDEGPLDYGIKYALTSQNQLIILSSDEDDQKSYRARAINTQIGKEENSGFIHLNVTGDSITEIAPDIIVHPKDLKIVRGEEIAELECVANARPLHELETLWFKDGIPIENSGVGYTLNDPWNRTLAILSVNLTHMGDYSCQVRLRTGGFPTINSTAHVYVQEPPTFISLVKSESFVEYGSAITLPCDVIGEPKPIVTWYKNGDLLQFPTDR